MKRKGSAYTVVRNLDVGESAFFPIEKWNAVRSAASVLKRIYGSAYKVHIVLPSREDVMITRIA